MVLGRWSWIRLALPVSTVGGMGDLGLFQTGREYYFRGLACNQDYENNRRIYLHKETAK
jgi:hypothetical protein